MWAKYEYGAGASQANVVSDIVAILCGETVPSNLSAACVVGLTEITATVPAGWLLHDAAAGANSQVIKAPLVDDAAKFKYVEIVSPVANELFVYGYEEWNNVTHVGTGKTGNSTADEQEMDFTNGGRVYISASARHIVVAGSTAVYFGTNTNSLHVVAESARLQPWNTVGAGYPNFAVIETYNGFANAFAGFFPRIKDAMGNNLSALNARAYMTTVCSGSNDWGSGTKFPQGAGAKVPNASGGLEIPFMPIYLSNPSVFVAPVGEISSVCNVFALPKGVVGNLETITKGADDFVALKAGMGDYLIAVLKG